MSNVSNTPQDQDKVDQSVDKSSIVPPTFFETILDLENPGKFEIGVLLIAAFSIPGMMLYILLYLFDKFN